MVGAAIGSVFPGPGTAIGAVAGGIIGGAAGGWLGSEAEGALANAGIEGVTNAYNGAKGAVSGAASTVKGWLGG
ncbi:hypothetical protein JQS43_10520 [Natronosporangium hydrolyticum]|uniref:Glycine zipper domain-containing protein n=1 Tax=Natronosporangium hydrolyticum TaxID=2811111 RepID=A0A895YMH1_9ACTN|nr:hypothetical protein [Natronosporangium hydrolyticum]QSB16669.1 hypothetical protein JQS43_10520 [Natronosporangium hydrolyticum]